MNNDQKVIKNKAGLLNLAEMLGSVSDGLLPETASIALRRGQGLQNTKGHAMNLSSPCCPW